jgi:hypothetical protein
MWNCASSWANQTSCPFFQTGGSRRTPGDMWWCDDATGLAPLLLHPTLWRSSAWLLAVEFGGRLFSWSV